METIGKIAIDNNKRLKYLTMVNHKETTPDIKAKIDNKPANFHLAITTSSIKKNKFSIKTNHRTITIINNREETIKINNLLSSYNNTRIRNRLIYMKNLE